MRIGIADTDTSIVQSEAEEASLSLDCAQKNSVVLGLHMSDWTYRVNQGDSQFLLKRGGGRTSLQISSVNPINAVTTSIYLLLAPFSGVQALHELKVSLDT